MDAVAERLAVNYLKGKADAYVRDEIFDRVMSTVPPGARTITAAALELADGFTGGRSRRRNPALRRVRALAFAVTLVLGYLLTRADAAAHLPWLLAVWGPGHWASIVLAGAACMAAFFLLPWPALALGALAPPLKPHLYRGYVVAGLLPLLAYATWLNGAWAMVLTVPMAIPLVWPVIAEREIRKTAARLMGPGNPANADRRAR